MRTINAMPTIAQIGEVSTVNRISVLSPVVFSVGRLERDDVVAATAPRRDRRV